MPWKFDRFIVLNYDGPRSVDLDDPGGDRIRFRLKVERGHVVDFVIQYETPLFEAGQSHASVIRSDWSHGVPHYDVYDRSGGHRKLWLPPSLDAKQTIELVLDDLSRNWRRYRAIFFAEHP